MQTVCKRLLQLVASVYSWPFDTCPARIIGNYLTQYGTGRGQTVPPLSLRRPRSVRRIIHV